VLRAHPNLSLLLFVYLAALACITLTPAGSVEPAASVLAGLADTLGAIDGLHWVDFGVVEAVANVALFVPMGVLVLLLLGRERWWAAIAVGVIASCWIELAQAVLLPTRVADPADLAWNSVGTAVGVAVVLGATLRPAGRPQTIDKRTARQAGA
jgi:hypothetical protein